MAIVGNAVSRCFQGRQPTDSSEVTSTPRPYAIDSYRFSTIIYVTTVAYFQMRLYVTEAGRSSISRGPLWIE